MLVVAVIRMVWSESHAIIRLLPTDIVVFHVSVKILRLGVHRLVDRNLLDVGITFGLVVFLQVITVSRIGR